MYLTALHVHDRTDREEIHAFFHRHDRAACAFPRDAPLSVPELQPGRLVAQWPAQPWLVRPGGNRVIAYLDFIVPDDQWSPKWVEKLASFGELMRARSMPWVLRLGEAHVVFGASEMPDPVAEYHELANVVVDLAHQQGLMP
jgi:hypothetical protein